MGKLKFFFGEDSFIGDEKDQTIHKDNASFVKLEQAIDGNSKYYYVINYREALQNAHRFSKLKKALQKSKTNIFVLLQEIPKNKLEVAPLIFENLPTGELVLMRGGLVKNDPVKKAVRQFLEKHHYIFEKKATGCFINKKLSDQILKNNRPIELLLQEIYGEDYYRNIYNEIKGITQER